jgi:hypothetical protein
MNGSEFRFEVQEEPAERQTRRSADIAADNFARITSRFTWLACNRFARLASRFAARAANGKFRFQVGEKSAERTEGAITAGVAADGFAGIASRHFTGLTCLRFARLTCCRFTGCTAAHHGKPTKNACFGTCCRKNCDCGQQRQQDLTFHFNSP